MRFFNPQIRILWNFELRTQRISQRYLPHSSSASRLPWPHRGRPGASALVLVVCRSGSDDSFESRRDL
jgi:hypothetical protein